jgi:hypothetical protein
MLVATSGTLQGKWFPEADCTNALTKAHSFAVVLVTRMVPHFVHVDQLRLIHTHHAGPIPCRATKGLHCVFPI